MPTHYSSKFVNILIQRYKDNCGTGAGGFQSGNECQVGSGKGRTSGGSIKKPSQAATKKNPSHGMARLHPTPPKESQPFSHRVAAGVSNVIHHPARAAAAVIHVPQHAAEWAVGHLPEKYKKPLIRLKRLYFATYKAGHMAAVDAAKKAGVSEKHVKTLAALLTVVDVIGSQAAPAAAHLAGWGAGAAIGLEFAPIASLIYLAIHASKDRVAVMESAREAIKKTLHEIKDVNVKYALKVFDDPKVKLAQRLAEHEGDEYYVALICAALDTTKGDLEKAIDAADHAYEHKSNSEENGKEENESRTTEYAARRMGSKISRYAFLYLDPKGDHQSFAQCKSCVLWTSPEKNRCMILGPNFPVDSDDTCSLYVPGEPNPNGECLPLITPEEAGYESRQVRCENCKYFDESRSICELYDKLNQTSDFDLDIHVNKYGCCNANSSVAGAAHTEKYAAPTADNCGTGAGGFQLGNECQAGGKDGSSQSLPSTRRRPASPGGKQAGQAGQAKPTVPIKKKAVVGKMVAAKRIGKGKEAKIVLADGSPAPSHINPSLVPPDYTDVTISLDPNADLLMKARDAGGHIVSRYRADYIANNAAAKFARSKEMLEKADLISKQNQENRKDLAKREAADCTWLIEEQATRPGSETDTGAKHKAYGATTLRNYHVIKSEKGDVWLRFVGKKGVKHSHKINNPELAKMLWERKETAGERGGQLFGTDEKKLNSYIRTLDGGSFTSKDFRTLKANKLAIEAINKVKKIPKTLKEYKQKVKEVAEFVSKVLGNKPSEALKSYIDPVVFSAWRPV